MITDAEGAHASRAVLVLDMDCNSRAVHCSRGLLCSGRQDVKWTGQPESLGLPLSTAPLPVAPLPPAKALSSVAPKVLLRRTSLATEVAREDRPHRVRNQG